VAQLVVVNESTALEFSLSKSKRRQFVLLIDPSFGFL
jgi:hypothetical protein